MNNLKRGVINIIELTFGMLMILTLVGAIRSQNLSLEMISISCLGITIFIIGAAILSYKYLNKIGNKIILPSIVLFCTIILQFVFVRFIHPQIGFDLYDFSLVNQFHKDSPIYFGSYPNNMLLLILQHEYVEIFGINAKSYWFALDILNTILVDISALLNILAAYIYNKKILSKAMWVNIFWLLGFTMILIPYSDTAALPFISLSLLIFIILSKAESNRKVFVYSSVLGVLTVVEYYIKPTAMIPVIAFWIIYSIFKIKKKKYLITLMMFMIFAVPTFIGLKTVIQNQNFTKIDASQKMPIVHWIDMGMKNKGGFDPESTRLVRAEKTMEGKKRVSIDGIKNTLSNKKLGYIKFLLVKQKYNTSDGTFDWLGQPGYLEGNSSENLVTEYIYPNGKKLNDFKFMSQVKWIIALIFILLTVLKTSNKMEAILKLSVIGFFVFLLIFEGGRTRYMIQIIPVFIMLVSISNVTSINWIRERIGRIKDILMK